MDTGKKTAGASHARILSCEPSHLLRSSLQPCQLRWPPSLSPVPLRYVGEAACSGIRYIDSIRNAPTPPPPAGAYVRNTYHQSKILNAQRRQVPRRTPSGAIWSTTSSINEAKAMMQKNASGVIAFSAALLLTSMALPACCMPRASAVNDHVYASKNLSKALTDADDLLQRAGVETKDSLSKQFPYPNKGKINAKPDSKSPAQ